MKKTVIIFLALFIYFPIHAQQDTKTDQLNKEAEEIQTLFSHSGRPGWWVSPEFAWTQFEGRDGFLGGFSGGIIIDHAFSIGLAGYGIMNSQNLNYSGINDTADVYLYGGYGGLRLEYRLIPLKKVNVAFPLLIGGGGVVYSTWDQDDWMNSSYYEDADFAFASDSYFVLEPGVMVGLNLLRFMRLDAGVSYRYTSGLNLPRTSSNLMNGFDVNLALRFGRF